MPECFSKDMVQKPSQPGSGPPGVVTLLEATMPERRAPRGELLELLVAAAGIFPGAVLEALIARLEAGR